MRVAVTGATGFVGRALCADLVAAGHTVIALTRRPEAARQRFAEETVYPLAEVEAREWNPPTVTALPPCDAVVHLAGKSIAAGRWSADQKREMWESRVGSAKALVESMAAMTPRPRVLVSASAVGYYGDRGDELLPETAPPGDDFLARLCVEWEAEARQAMTLDARVVRVRLGIVLGKGGGALKPMALPFRLGVGGQLGDGRQWVSWIHRVDAVGLFRHALECDAVSGPMNGVSPHPVRNSEFSRRLGRALHRPSFMRVPGFMLRLVAGELAETLLAGQQALPRVALETGYPFQFPTLKAAFADLYSG